MKVSELEGAALDYWVAKALGDREFRMRDGICETRFHPDFDFYRFSPTITWHEGGRIIDRERIGVMPRNGGWAAWPSGEMDPTGAGKTALEAAMRAYVHSKFGAEVE
ncbi:phage protein NinX family protein [Cupriavidus taiwanensis]|uniref:phage protein NinX family protein n=1 Tax=Cupriavidus taiwanensis TaxID=164546 RepID=UPI000E102AC5|nr:phage protein NinX family protein [Cupriavidus taiwanensis]SOY56788.1 conserved hypothetical protein [Cupriavidus taiwanensis]SOY90689.1 conserved hypothetical protein [Cupriavidus taiwanensis]SOZ63493.1 conserved hypothetical protein [Cupriavidus taiwanensis]SOZ82486.1 conserved hypothetical protein [Cupriavidus taiwanensis]SOZ84378.1 conserved hypothetical protein [Cupriavidus taiwanensis]